jgi:hypothetical protein
MMAIALLNTKIKVKFTLEHTMKAQAESRGIFFL